MAIKKCFALMFILLLTVMLFYGGINLAEQGAKDLLGLPDPPGAFHVYIRESGELEIFWSGKSLILQIPRGRFW